MGIWGCNGFRNWWRFGRLYVPIAARIAGKTYREEGRGRHLGVGWIKIGGRPTRPTFKTSLVCPDIFDGSGAAPDAASP